MSGRFSGKVAVVTGASKGIGAAIAVRLASEGASVAVNYARDKAGADAVVAAIEKAAAAAGDKGVRAVAVQGDLSVEADVRRVFAGVKAAFGRADVLVNNAGVYEFAPLEAITVDHYRRQFDLNVLGLLLSSQEAVKLMGAAGGVIVNISSVVAVSAPPATAVYSGTKGAVDSITQALARELGPRKIRVVSINPGLVDTEGVRSAGIHESEMKKAVEAQTPVGRIGRPEDIAAAVAYVASDDAAWVSGETLVVSGGYR